MENTKYIKSENIHKVPTQASPPKNLKLIRDNLSFNTFFEHFLLPNQPCIIKNVSNNWKCMKYWLAEDKKQVNFKYLRKKYGNDIVLTYDCKTKFYNSHKADKITFSKYLDYWQDFKASDYSKKYPLLYLKDWHLKNNHPHDEFYQVPTCFSSDWLNEYLVANQKDDYRFVYMGPRGTWTPLHSDVFKSYSWSVNIIGAKKWVFLPPGEENRLRDKLGNLPHEIVDIPANCKHYNVIQNAGDAIFVPSGWYHQVINLEDTISINHNWLNGCNINLMYLDMQHHLDEVKVEIADCKDDPEFVSQCQIVLNASYGMDFENFLKFLTWITEVRLSQSEKDNLMQFDLRMLKSVLEKFMGYPDVKILKLFGPAEILYNQICSSLENV